MNAKQEILELMQRSYNITCNACGQNVRPYLSDIRAILSTHTLEPIDDRDFSPAILGWFLTADVKKESLIRQRRWISKDEEWKISRTDSLPEAFGILYERNYDSDEYEKIAEFPWPATQSDGERLLKLLGVLGDG